MRLESLRQDIAFVWRSCRRQPAFALIALATLTLGIGANTAIFSVINTVLLRPMPYPDPDRVVMIGTNTAASAPKLAAWRRQTDIFTEVSAYRGGFVNITGGAAGVSHGLAMQVPYAQASASFFTLFGANVAKGRGISAEDDRPHAGRVVLLSHRFWLRQFGGDPAIVGQRLLLDNEPHTIIGVLSDRFDPDGIGGFAFWGTPEMWVPLQLDPASLNQANDMLAAARLAPGVTLDVARARLHRVADDFRRGFPGVPLPNIEFGIESMSDVLTRHVRTSLWLLAGAVGLVLLIACANVANLLLARATARGREIAIRAAIGASRGRIARQLLTESLVLAIVSGACGLMVGMLGVRALLAINPAHIPRISGDAGAHGLPLDWRVFAFTAIVSLATGMVFGILPALHASRVDLHGVMKHGGRGDAGVGGGRHHATRSMLVIAELSLAVALLIGAALLIRSFAALRAVDPGFDGHRVLTMRMSLKDARFTTTAAVAQLVEDGVRRVRAVPGVEAASAGYCLPVQGYLNLRFTIIGRPSKDPYHAIGQWGIVSPGYFEVFKIPLRRGRLFTERDVAGAPPVIIISEALARQFFPHDDPLQHQLVLGRGLGDPFETEPARQIVGVVGDVHDSELSHAPEPTTYVPQAQLSNSLMSRTTRLGFTTWTIRTRVEPQMLASGIERALQDASHGVPVSHVRSMDAVMSEATASARFNAVLLGIFGTTALLLATVGVYGLMAYAVQQRTREIGIRIALGADTRRVRGMIIRQGMSIALPGIALGVVASYALTRLLASFLFGVGTHDPAVFVLVPLLLAIVAFVAGWLPGRAACRVDPIVALRSE
jgi:putative ABC transport system permease protein